MDETKRSNWGGRRPGAGRKPNGPTAMVSHKARPRFAAPKKVEVILRMAAHVPDLHGRRVSAALEETLADAKGRFGMRVLRVTPKGRQLHLLVQAQSSEGLSSGMQGFNVRLAKALNRVMGRHGSVFADHYELRLVATRPAPGARGGAASRR